MPWYDRDAVDAFYTGVRNGSQYFNDVQSGARQNVAEQIALEQAQYNAIEDSYERPYRLGANIASHKYNALLADADADTLTKVRPYENATAVNQNRLAANKYSYQNENLNNVAPYDLAANKYNAQTGAVKAGLENQTINATAPDIFRTNLNNAELSAINSGVNLSNGRINYEAQQGNLSDLAGARDLQYQLEIAQGGAAYSDFKDQRTDVVNARRTQNAVNSITTDPAIRAYIDNPTNETRQAALGVLRSTQQSLPIGDPVAVGLEAHAAKLGLTGTQATPSVYSDQVQNKIATELTSKGYAFANGVWTNPSTNHSISAAEANYIEAARIGDPNLKAVGDIYEQISTTDRARLKAKSEAKPIAGSGVEAEGAINGALPEMLSEDGTTIKYLPSSVESSLESNDLTFIKGRIHRVTPTGTETVPLLEGLKYIHDALKVEGDSNPESILLRAEIDRKVETLETAVGIAAEELATSNNQKNADLGVPLRRYLSD